MRKVGEIGQATHPQNRQRCFTPRYPKQCLHYMSLVEKLICSEA